MGFLDDETDSGGFLEDEDTSSDTFLEDVEEKGDGFLNGELGENTSGKVNQYPPPRKNIPDDKFRNEYWKDGYFDRTDHTEELSAGIKKVKCVCDDYSCIPKRQRWTTCPSCGKILIDFGWENHHP